jgi:hypothetical protein
MDLKEAEAEAYPELAEQILGEPVAPVVLPNAPKTETKFRTVYGVEVVDLDALIKAVYEKTAPRMALMANEKYLGERARSDKEEFSIDGCKLTKRLA